MHGGLPTDRFICQWRIRTPHVERRIRPAGLTATAHAVAAAPVVNRTASAGRWIEPRGFDGDLDEPRVHVEIPTDYTPMLSAEPDLAHAWRLESRAIFQRYLSRGYRVVDFALDEAHGRGRYLLTTIRNS